MNSGLPVALPRLQWIQILRGIAASAVVVHHAGDYAFAHGGLPANQIRVFAAGVDVFFVISGFIMMMVSDPHQGRDTKASTFIRSRITRIVPLYWTYTTGLIIAAALVPGLLRSTELSTTTALKSLLFVPYFQENGNFVPVLAVGWTLNYEMGFYLVFALLISLGMKARVLSMLAVFSALFVIGKLIGQTRPLGAFFANSVTFEFIAGMALYLIFRSGIRPTPVHGSILLAFAIAWFVWCGLQPPPSSDWRFIFWGMPAAVIVAAVLSFGDIPGHAGRFLEFLGDASYSIYLSHLFTVGAFFAIANRLGIASSWISVPFSILASLLCGVLSYQWIETSLLRISRSGLRQLMPRQPVS